MQDAGTETLLADMLPAGIRARRVDNANGLRVHLLEAGDPRAPCLLLLHGFPELAYSWRKLMVPLAEVGYHVVAPDQRGYGLTTGWRAAYDDDTRPFELANLVVDMLGVLAALGHATVAAVAGHDFGASVAAACALTRPDIFRAVALMSAPFTGAPALTDPALTAPPCDDPIHAALASLPRPRKHYQLYYATRSADADMRLCRQGLPAFLRAYFHVKSGDWPGNAPHPLAAWTAEELAGLPTYYVMDLARDMAATVAPEMPTRADAEACAWLTERELGVYAEAYARTGFQGALNWYRCRMDGSSAASLRLFAGRTIDVPCMFVAGGRDWGIHQVPGALERMRDHACTAWRGCHLVDGAGHWVQQERAPEVTRHVLEFLDDARRR